MSTEASGFFVYGLYASDDFETVKYVGSTTQALAKRLVGHRNEMSASLRFCRPTGSAKLVWMKHVVARGAAVEIRLLSVHANKKEMLASELGWIRFLNNRLQLTNAVFDRYCYRHT
jgi:predicted GIY-YIG superfamily endonuclease